MAFPIVWDDRTLEHIERHGVSKADVLDAMRRRFYWRSHGGGLLIIGRTDGRFLFLVLARATTRVGFWQLRTARLATPAEKRLFRRRVKGSR